MLKHVVVRLTMARHLIMPMLTSSCDLRVMLGLLWSGLCVFMTMWWFFPAVTWDVGLCDAVDPFIRVSIRS